MQNGRTFQTWFIVALVAYLVLHIVTLHVSPLPWFDEVVFADVTRSYVNEGSMEMTIVPLYYKGEVYQYGPVYFVLQALIVKMFGLGPVSFRLLNLVCGLGGAAILYRIFSRSTNVPKVAYAFAGLVLLDTIFIQNLHSGRMDLVAFFFVTCSLLYVDHFKKEGRLYQLVLVGVFGAISFLTTPRALFLLTAPAVFFMLTIDREKGTLVFEKDVIRNGAIALLIFIVIILSTISLTVGLPDYIAGMTSASKNGKPMTEFIGGQLLREPYENHLIILMIATVVFYFRNVIRSPLVIGLLTGFCAFSLFVNETGPYSAMIMPFVYFIVLILILPAPDRVRNILIALLLVINAGMFTLKTTVILTSMDRRNVNSEYYSQLDSIPAGSKVLATFRFFYWAAQNNHQFESYSVFNGSESAYVQHMVYEYIPDYIILTPGDERRIMFNHGDFVNNYQVMMEIRLDDPPAGQLERFAKRFFSFDDNFACVIYKRIDRSAM